MVMCIWGESIEESISRLRQKVGDLLVSQNVAPWTDVRDSW